MSRPGTSGMVVACVALLAGCLDYGISGEKDVTGTDSTTGFAPDTAGGSLDPAAACPDEPDLDDAVAVDESCVTTPSVGTLDTVEEWSLYTPSLEMHEYDQVLMAPVVGPLLDLDGDGAVTAADPPCIVVVTDDAGDDGPNAHGVLRVLDGRDGTVFTSVSEVETDDYQVFPYRYANVALGDIDGDGAAEIVTVVTVVGGPPVHGGDDTGSDTDTSIDTGGGGDGGGPDDTGVIVRPPPPAPPPPSDGPCRVAAYEADGTLEWLAEDPAILCGGHAPALADLDGDGAVEVIVGATVLEGADGSLRFSGSYGAGRPTAFPEAGWMSFAADLDGDGTQEVVTGSTLYEPDGTVRCTTGDEDGFPAAADLDGVGYGEWIVAANGRLLVYESDCSLRMERPLAGDGIGGPPTVGDLDADGLPEIGVADAETYTAYEADGTVLWSAPISDWSSSSAGAAFYDFDGDGTLEVVYADETTLWVFDGATGTVRLADDTHSSRTLHEVPVVADVDLDGHAEIVVPNGGAHSDTEATGLYVLGALHDDWTWSRSVWNQHAYAITNVDDDLTIPTSPTSNWPTYNTFRSGALGAVTGGDIPDAVPVVDVCTDACDSGVVVIDVAVGNGGVGPLQSGVPISIYADNDWLATAWTGAIVASGEVSDSVRFELDAADVAGRALRVVADDEDGIGRVVECVETNNELDEAGCP